jgi:hypothetical protein
LGIRFQIWSLAKQLKGTPWLSFSNLLLDIVPNLMYSA